MIAKSVKMNEKLRSDRKSYLSAAEAIQAGIMSISQFSI